MRKAQMPPPDSGTPRRGTDRRGAAADKREKRTEDSRRREDKASCEGRFDIPLRHFSVFCLTVYLYSLPFLIRLSFYFLFFTVYLSLLFLVCLSFSSLPKPPSPLFSSLLFLPNCYSVLLPLLTFYVKLKREEV